MTDTITKRIRMRQGDSVTAKTKNEVLRQGEAFWETDTGDIKVGDGETHYNSLLGIVSESKIAQEIANGTYMGKDLAVKFAAEIAAYNGDVVDWLHARVQAGNFKGIYPFDYIHIHTNAGTVAGNNVPAKNRKFIIAGINLYKGTGETEITQNHITFFALADENVTWNDVNNNNGTATNEYPWKASKLYAVLNGVNNASSNKVGACGFNAAGAGYLQLFPTKVQNLMLNQQVHMGKRYSSTAVLTDDNSQGWTERGKLFAPSEIEAYGCAVHAYKISGAGNSEQYGPWCHWPIFRNAGNTGRLIYANRASWWLCSVPFGLSTLACDVTGDGLATCTTTSHMWLRAPLCFHFA